MGWFHFLNLQYWYCIIYSIFGGRCAYLDELNAANPARPGVIDGVMAFVAAFSATFWGTTSGVVIGIWHAFSALSYAVSGFLAFAILIAVGSLVAIRMRELKTYGTLPPKVGGDTAERTRWQTLLEDAKSTDPSRWRTAILGADSMLGELLEKLGYQGLNTGERMQKLPEDAFVTVPVAWEAHRVKNFISSGSSDFVLTQREAFRVMKLYEQVFEEFQLL